MNVNESAAASTKVVGAAAIISRALYRVLTIKPGGKILISIFPACDDQHIREDEQNPIMMYTPAKLNLFFDIMKPVLNLNISERELRNINSTHPGIFPSQPTNSHNTSRFKGYLKPYLRILPRPQ